MAQEVFRHHALHMFDDKGNKMSMEKLLKGPDGQKIWSRALSNEWGRLAQGNKYGVKATNTINFIKHSEVPNKQKVTYASFVCDHQPLKTEE